MKRVRLWIWGVGALVVLSLVGANIAFRAKNPSAEGMGLALRQSALEVKAADLGLQPEPGKPYGVVVDLSDGVASIVAFANGNVSLHLNKDGGVMGGGSQAPVRRAVQSLVESAAAAPLPASDDDRLPAAGEIRITALTPEGRRSAVAKERDLESGNHPLSPVFLAANDVITALRNASP